MAGRTWTRNKGHRCPASYQKSVAQAAQQCVLPRQPYANSSTFELVTCSWTEPPRNCSASWL